MATFEKIIKETVNILDARKSILAGVEWLIVNIDINGKVRFIVPDRVCGISSLQKDIESAYTMLAERVMPHAYSTNGIFYESAGLDALTNPSRFLLDGFNNVWVVNRTGHDSILPNFKHNQVIQRVVCHSHSDNLNHVMLVAQNLVSRGKRVLLIDANFEFPHLHYAGLSLEHRPEYGVMDWLVEDLCDNGNTALYKMVEHVNSYNSYTNGLYVIPSHGIFSEEEYIVKLERAWMPKRQALDKPIENGVARFERLISMLETNINPDVVLVNAPCGISSTATNCIIGLNAGLGLLFLDSNTTGYKLLFKHWQRIHGEKFFHHLRLVYTTCNDIYDDVFKNIDKVSTDETYTALVDNMLKLPNNAN